jgi:hypothetical protein
MLNSSQIIDKPLKKFKYHISLNPSSKMVRFQSEGGFTGVFFGQRSEFPVFNSKTHHYIEKSSKFISL